MNILIVADLVTYSGVGNYIKSLSIELVRQGNSVVVASPCNDIGLGADDGIVYVKLNRICKNPFTWNKNVKILKMIVEKYNIDVIHVNHRMSAFIVGLYNKRHKHIPTVWTAHTVPYPMNIIKKLFSYYGDEAIAISSEAKLWMEQDLHIAAEKISLVLNGVDESVLTQLSDDRKQELQEKWNIDKDKIVICLHGRLDYVKGLDLIVEAINKLSADEKGKIIVLCSGKYDANAFYDSLIAQIEQYGLKNIFRFAGWCDSRDILGVSNLMLQPSRREGFPLAALEAFFMGVPVVRSKVGGYDDMKDVCIGIERESVEEIVEQIRSYIDGKYDFPTMASRAKEFALQQCTIRAMANNSMEVYKKAILRVGNNT